MLKLFAAAAFLLVTGAACRSDAPPKPDDGGTTTAPAPIVDAGTAPPPSDAGELVVAAAAASVFDRILLKPTDTAMTPEDAKALVEATLGVKVAAVRRTAVGWILVTLAPESRDEAAQQTVIAKLKAVPAFSAVEGDRVMKIR